MRKGMTLIEMIIAVAMLSFLGMVVLQMFLSAQTMNQKAKELDMAVMQCVRVVETMKSINGSDTITAVNQNKLLLTAVKMETENASDFVWFYDAQMLPLPVTNENDAYYRMRLIWEEDRESNRSTGLVTVTYERVKKSLGFSDEKAMLYQLTAGVPAVPGGEQP